MEKNMHLALSLGQKRKAHFLDNKVTTLETTFETVSDDTLYTSHSYQL